MDHSGSSSGSDDEDETTQASHQPQQAELVTRLQLRLSASHLPRLGRFNLSRRGPDTFATVVSIFEKNKSNDRDQLSSHLVFQNRNQDEDCLVEWGSTEVVQNSRSPQWIQTIPLKYEYGSECFFYVRIMSASDGKRSPKGRSSQSISPLSDGGEPSTSFDGTPQKERMGHCFGTALFEVGDILGSRNYTKVKRLKAGGCVYARVEPFQDENENKARFRFQFEGLDLLISRSKLSQRLNLVSEPTTVLEIARRHDTPSAQSWITIFRSRPVIHSSNPCWDLAEIDLESCSPNGDLSTVVRLSVFRVKKAHKQKLVGLCETTIHNIIANAQAEGEEVALSEKNFLLQKNMRQFVQVGQLRVKVASMLSLSGRVYPGPLGCHQSTVTSSPASSPNAIQRTDSIDTTTSHCEDPFNIDLRHLSLRSSATQNITATTLSEFIDKGGQLDFSVAIDFTSSNGSPLQPGSLHFQNEEVLNDYEETITSIGNVVDKYNQSSEYCVWGFGAKFGDGIVRHLFQCGQHQTVKGVEGILDAYRSAFRSGGIYMSGPTVFVKAIQAAAVKARQNKMAGANTYSILLIVTDGIMDSFEETREKLSVYSEVPLSVIFVGVGRTDFRSMYALCDAPLLRPGTRKNTTFVEFRQHQHDPRSLAQAALSQIPKQLTEYMIQNGVALP